MPHEITHLCLFRISYEKQVLKEVAGRNKNWLWGWVTLERLLYGRHWVAGRLECFWPPSETALALKIGSMSFSP